MKKLLILLCAVSVMATAVLAGCNSRGGDAQSSSSASESAESADASGESDADSEGIRLVQFEDPSEDALTATITTSMGEFKAVLFPEYAPKAVENFYTHAKEGYYNGLTFHQVLSNLAIYTGDPNGDGTGGESIWGEPFEDEFTDDLWNFRGALSMANTGKDSNGSQFFVVQATSVDSEVLKQMEEHSDVFPQEVIDKYKEVGGAPWLDHVNTVFGQVISGMKTVDEIAGVEVDENDKPKDTVIIESIEFNKEMDYAGTSAGETASDESSK